MELIPALARGFGLGLGLIVAIGAQNAFVLERGLLRDQVLPVVTLCALSDALLILAGVAGLGSLISNQPTLIGIVRYAGAAFLLAYAVLALMRALRPQSMVARGGRQMSRTAAVATALGLTFLNPHVYLDTVVLLGSLSATYSTASGKAAYALGAMSASLIWFVCLGYGARLLAPLFARPIAWRVLDLIIAGVMAGIAVSLIAGGR